MQDDVSIQLEALDILSDMLGRLVKMSCTCMKIVYQHSPISLITLFDRLSTALVSFHQSILTSLLAQLMSPRMAVRKRSIIALGHLVPSCSPTLFTQLTEHLMGELSRGPPTASVRTYIQCLATVSRRGGHRIGERRFYIYA